MAYDVYITIPYHTWYDAYYIYLVANDAHCGSEHESKFDRVCGLEFVDFVANNDPKPGLYFRIRNRKRYTWAVLQYGF